VYTPYLDKTVHGAVRWFDNKPLIQISDKGKCLATIWYTLFHEIGHVLLHENDEIFEGNMDLPKAQIDKKEKEANSFAYEYLFNGDNLRKFIFMQRNKYVEETFISTTSSKFSTPKIFVAYWMKKANVKSRDRQNYLPSISFGN
jgi:Zn-dependent peptidase ImmA (M78 family)